MNNETLRQNLRDLVPADLSWKFALYSTHKSRDGFALDINACKMQLIVPFVDTLRTTLLEKTLEDRTAVAYSPFLPKENIGAMETSSELIREPIADILINTQNAPAAAPEDFVSGVLPSPKGCIFYGYQTDEDGKIVHQVLFMKKGSPFLSANKVRLCITGGDAILDSTKPLLKFTQATDFLMIGEVCYFINPAIEKDFGLESRHVAICMKRLSLLAEAGIINDYDQFERIAVKNSRKFLDFDRSILDHIARLDKLQREEWLLTYGVTIDHEGRMDTADTEQCAMLIDLLCGRSCIDPMGRLATGSNITPR